MSAWMDWDVLLDRAGTEPIGIDISDYGDDFCVGFLVGQRHILEELYAGRLELPGAAPSVEEQLRRRRQLRSRRTP